MNTILVWILLVSSNNIANFATKQDCEAALDNVRKSYHNLGYRLENVHCVPATILAK